VKKPGKQITLFAVLLTTLVFLMSQDESVVDWWRRGRPPHPYIMPASIAAWRLTVVPLDDQFTHTFYYGEECGRRLSLEKAAARGRVVPRKLRAHFYDGVGHGYAPGDDVLDTVEQIELHIPEQHMMAIHDGVLRHHTMTNMADPELVVPFAENYIRLSGLPEPYNGVRIGLQRTLGGRLPEALQVAASYPEAYWPALFEELGWRASRHKPARTQDAPSRLLDDDAYWQEAMAWVVDHQQYVPEAAMCHYIHGAARGRALGYPWQDQSGWIRIQDELDGFDKDCRTAAYQGIGWAVFIQAAHRPTRVKKMLRSITDETGRAIAQETLSQIEASLASKDAEPLSLWDIEGVKITTPAATPAEAPDG
jgi:hypothetical protein